MRYRIANTRKKAPTGVERAFSYSINQVVAKVILAFVQQRRQVGRGSTKKRGQQFNQYVHLKTGIHVGRVIWS